jgi:threonine/homoserine/homoserine lactone efflux protein
VGPWIVSAFGLGFAYAALPGTVNAEALRRGLAGGFQRSLLVHCGGLIGAAFWAIFALTGATLVSEYDVISVTLGVVGVAFLIRLTIVAVRGALPHPPQVNPDPRPGADLSVGMLVGVMNPAGIPFWTGLASGVVAENGGELSRAEAALFVASVMLGSVLWALILSSLVAWGRRFLNAAFFRVVNALCALAFGYFAVRMIESTIRAIAD